MLEELDLFPTISKDDYRDRMETLEAELGRLQRQLREFSIPAIILFEGWGASGKGTLINNLILSMDPRGFRVYSTRPPAQEERMRPFLWRFWKKLPEKGRIALFDRSWYGRVLAERVDRVVSKKEVALAYEHINAFERQLIDDGYAIVKLFLHISKKEQRKRFEKLASDDTTAWRITKEDWKHHAQYEVYYDAVESMLEKTGTLKAPWTAVEAHDLRFATVKVFETVTAVLRKAVDAARERARWKTAPPLACRGNGTAVESVLGDVDLSLSLTKEEYEAQLKKYQTALWELEHAMYRKRLSAAIVFEGWDAAGKGGAIKRLAEALDPRGYEVVPFGAPNDVERRHHYLWRFWNCLPKAGHITIFDRSWYGRVLVERVEGLCRDDEWRRAYGEINETEAQWVDFGMVILKFWLHIDRAEQLARFKEREKIPDKRWKITEEDWRNRKKWNLYKQAVDEMIFRTDKPCARWTVVEANSKLFARIRVLKTVVTTIERAL